MTILGIDYGGTRTGLAVGNTLMKIAHPLETVTTKKDEEKLVKIQSVIKEWRVGKIVIGIPSSLHHSSTNQSIVAKINNFINLLKENTTLDITSVNEDFSSFGASQALSEQNIRGHKQKKHLDSMAACIILQQYFDEACKMVFNVSPDSEMDEGSDVNQDFGVDKDSDIKNEVI